MFPLLFPYMNNNIYRAQFTPNSFCSWKYIYISKGKIYTHEYIIIMRECTQWNVYRVRVYYYSRCKIYCKRKKCKGNLADLTATVLCSFFSSSYIFLLVYIERKVRKIFTMRKRRVFGRTSEIFFVEIFASSLSVWRKLFIWQISLPYRARIWYKPNTDIYNQTRFFLYNAISDLNLFFFFFSEKSNES